MAGRVKGLRKLQMAMFVVGNPQHKKGGRAVYMMEDELCITQADISEGPERTLVVYCKKGFSATTTIACFLVDEEYVFAAAADDDEDGRYAAKFDGESFTFFRGDVEVTVDDAAWCADAYLKNVYVMDDFDREKTIPRRTEQLKCRNRVTFGALSDPEHACTVALVLLMNNLPSAADLRTTLGARLHARHVAACAIVTCNVCVFAQARGSGRPRRPRGRMRPMAARRRRRSARSGGTRRTHMRTAIWWP